MAQVGTSTRTGGARYCQACDRTMADGLPNACIGTLPEVTSACCGHGDPAKAYIVYNDGNATQGVDAIEAMGLPSWRPPKGA